MTLHIDNWLLLAFFLIALGADYVFGLGRTGRIVIGVVAIVLGVILLVNRA